MSFSTLARDTRRKNRRYLREVADAVGISVAYVSEIERGNRPVPVYLAREWAEAVLGDPDEFEAEAMKGREVLSIPFGKLSHKQRVASFFFAKTVQSLSDDTCDLIFEVIKREVLP